MQSETDIEKDIKVLKSLLLRNLIVSLWDFLKIYKKRKLLGEILDLLKKDIFGGKSEKYSTRGLCYWEILVLSAVRHGCNLDHDILQDLANDHKKLLFIIFVCLLQFSCS